MIMSSAHIPTTTKECLKRYVENLVSLLALLSPEILPGEGVTIHLWKNYMGMGFDVQFAVRFDYSFL